MTQPWFYTQRLLLRPAAAHDLDALWELWRDADVRRFLFDDEPVSRERAAAVLEAALAQAREDNGSLGLWLVLPHDDGQVLGCAGILRSTAPDLPEALRGQAIEPSAALYPAYWGWGYAQEALRALLDHVRRVGQDHLLVGVCDVPNRASERMLRSLGFEPRYDAAGPRGASHRLRYFMPAQDADTTGPPWGGGPTNWP